jgi:hypothetical protein
MRIERLVGYELVHRASVRSREGNARADVLGTKRGISARPLSPSIAKLSKLSKYDKVDNLAQKTKAPDAPATRASSRPTLRSLHLYSSRT